jgi:hypothetical protein
VPPRKTPLSLRALATSAPSATVQALSTRTSVLVKTLACLILLLLVTATPVRGETAITVGSEQPIIDRLTESFRLAPSDEGNQTDSVRSIAPLGVERDPGKIANEIVFIDPGVEDYETLEAGFREGVEVLILKDTQDGVTQISQALLGKTGLDAIHLISHGSAGSLQLGSTELSSDRMAHYSNALSQIGSSLTETGDIMLYGCDVAQGDTGQEFVLALANATDADVAASIDKTGAMILGGNWDLEYSHGEIGEIGETLLTKNLHATNFNQLLDTESPTATVELDADFISSTSNSTTLTITFSEDIAFSEVPGGFNDGDLILSNGSITAGSYDSSNFTYTALFTADSNIDATGGVELVAGSYEDAAGNIGGGSSDTAYIDTQNPTSTITFNGSLLSSVSNTTTVTIAFSEDPVGFDETDLVVSNGILSGFSGQDTVWTATFEAASNFAGDGGVQLPGGSYTDHVDFLNPGVGSSGSISIDTESPTATVDLAATSLSASNNSTVLTITFSEVPLGFDAGADLTVIGGALGSGSFDASDKIWTATFTANDGITGTGSVSLTGSYTDLTDNSGSGASDSVAINTALDQAPTAVDVYAATLVSTASTPQSATVVLEGADPEADALTYTVVSAPSNGSLSDPNNGNSAVTTGAIAGQTLTYTPTTDYTGTDTFTYRVNDGVSDSTATYTATITVFDAVRTQARQIGADIDGEAAGDQSGLWVTLSSDGQTLAVGAIRNDGNGGNAGHVRVYAWNGSAWSQLGGDIDGEAASDLSGWSVALSSDGQTLAVGAYFNDGNGDAAGHVRVYAWSGSAWSQLGGDIDGEATGDNSGWSVALSSDGQTLAVGAIRNDGNGDNAGHVRVYAWSGSAWSQQGGDIDGEAAGDQSGYSVALSSDGQTLAVGAFQNDGNGSFAGHVRVYAWDGSAWIQLGDDIDGEAAVDQSGWSVALSSDGQTLAVGAYGNDGTGSSAGHVRVYAWNGSAWSQLGADIDGEAAGDQSGYSVALSSDGQTLAVGAPYNDGNGGNAGHVRVYAWNGLEWIKLGGDIDGEAADDRSGYSVTLSSDGRSLAVGADLNAGNGADAGQVRVYDLTTATPQISGTANALAVSGVAYQAFDDPDTALNPTERLTVSDSDPADNNRTFSATAGGGALPGWLAVDAATGALSGTPTADDVGVLANVVLTVSDGTLSADLPAFDLTVLLDTDEDGQPNDCDANCVASGFAADADDDNDGVVDDNDRYPLVSLTVNAGTANEETLSDANGNGAPDAVGANCDEACIILAGMALDQAPTAVDVYAATLVSTASTPQSATVVLEGADPEADALTYTVVSAPSNGSLSDPNNGNSAVTTGAIAGQTLTYTPTTDYTGTDTFTYRVNDGVSDSTTTYTATITVFDGVRTQARQIGADIDGEAAGDYSGWSVALSSDGQTLAVGAYPNDGNGSAAGHVRVYAWNGLAWAQLGADIDGEAAGDFSGRSVSLSSDGQTVAIGAFTNDGNNGTDSGHVRVYGWDGSSWTQLGGDIDGEARDNLSGVSVSLSSDGQTVAIGAYINNDNGTYSGHVRVHGFNGSTWNQRGADIDGEAAGDYSGRSVSLSSDGQTVAIGAYKNDGNGTDSGHVRVYDWDGSSWTQLGADIDGEAADDYSGLSVSLSSDGRTVGIGAFANDGNNGTDSGHVRIYGYDGSTWNQRGADIDGEALGDNSGYSVALSSDGLTVAIGAHLNDDNDTDSGHVRIYGYDGSTWNQRGADIDGEAALDKSGFSVALSSDGQTLAMGAPLNDGNGDAAGHVRVYDLKTFAPEIGGTANRAAVSGVAYEAFDDPATAGDATERLTVSDPDPADNNRTFSATAGGSALPGWLAVDAATGALSGTPTADDVGVLANVVLTVSDGTLSADLPAFDLTVLLDTDEDGQPDDCDANCAASGFAVDGDDDNDGINDNLDLAPQDNGVGALPTVSSTDPGTEGNPYLIGTLTELEGLSTTQGYWTSGVYLRLTADIDASDTSTWNAGAGFSPIGNASVPFAGSFDGAGFAISNLAVNRPASDQIGLFGGISGADITDLGVTNASITGDDYVGGLVGRALDSSTITDSYATGAVTGSGFYVGGLVGSCALDCSITASYATVAVTGSGNAVGGLVGIAFSSSITASSATGAVTGGTNVGGLVGSTLQSSVSASYATGAVGGVKNVGGLVGNAFNNSSITDSYATGAVEASLENVGGLVGNGITNSSITDSYWDTDKSTQSQGVGSTDGTLTGTPTGLTSTEMLAQSSFVGFDFVTEPPGDPVSYTPWVMIDGRTQPYLYWQDDDGDDVAAYVDPDDDNDGVDDGLDDFPLNAAASLDTDGDGLPNVWNAGCDPTCQDASGLTLDGDDDNDGVADGEDTDPLDPKVCRDVDNDLADDCSVGTDGFGPLDDFNPSNDGLDTDGDGLADVGDPDDDNDLVDDGLDACPSTPSQESVDAQGCSETQKDDDGDGVNNATDSCPDTASAEIGLVSTGGCGPSERDTDGDGTNDNLDAFPNDPNETLDSDGDGYGDNEETEAGTDPNDADDQPIQSGLPIWLLYEASKP